MAISVDRLQGLSGDLGVKCPVRVATTANIPLSGLQTIDGITVAAGDRVLVKDQTDAADNGIWDAATSSWSRSLDFDGANDAVAGTMVIVSEGTTNGGQIFLVSNIGTITIGTTPLTWANAFLSTFISSIGSSLIGFIHSGVNAVLRTVQDKLREKVSVFDFMTPTQIADIQSFAATIDVTSAIESAIVATYGKKLFFPKGKYRHTGLGLDPLLTSYWYGEGYDPNGVSGTILHNVGTTHSIAIQNTGAANDVPHVFKDMMLNGNASSGSGIWGDNAHGIRGIRLWITNHGASGVQLLDGWSNKFKHCVIAHNKEHGVSLQNRCNNVTLDQCTVNSNGYTPGCANVSLNANVGYENLNVNILNNDMSSAQPGSFNLSITNSWGVNVRGNYSESSDTGLLYVGSNTKSVSVESNYFQDGIVTLDAGDGHRVVGNVLHKYGAGATTLVAQMPAGMNWEIDNNSFENGATATYTGGSGTHKEVYGTAAPTSGTFAINDICRNTAIGIGDCFAWVCTLGGTPGTWEPIGVIPSVSTNWGDVGATLTNFASHTTNRWVSPLTANRAVTLSTTNAVNGSKFRIIRTIGSTGAFTLDVGTGPLKSLGIGQWCDVEYDGSAWVLTAYGAL